MAENSPAPPPDGRAVRESALPLDRDPFTRASVPRFGIDAEGWFVSEVSGATRNVTVHEVSLSVSRAPAFRATREWIRELARQLSETAYLDATGSGQFTAPATERPASEQAMGRAGRLIARLSDELEEATAARDNLLVIKPLS